MISFSTRYERGYDRAHQSQLSRLQISIEHIDTLLEICIVYLVCLDIHLTDYRCGIQEYSSRSSKIHLIIIRFSLSFFIPGGMSPDGKALPHYGALRPVISLAVIFGLFHFKRNSGVNDWLKIFSWMTRALCIVIALGSSAILLFFSSFPEIDGLNHLLLLATSILTLIPVFLSVWLCQSGAKLPKLMENLSSPHLMNGGLPYIRTKTAYCILTLVLVLEVILFVGGIVCLVRSDVNLRSTYGEWYLLLLACITWHSLFQFLFSILQISVVLCVAGKLGSGSHTVEKGETTANEKFLVANGCFEAVVLYEDSFWLIMLCNIVASGCTSVRVFLNTGDVLFPLILFAHVLSVICANIFVNERVGYLYSHLLILDYGNINGHSLIVTFLWVCFLTIILHVIVILSEKAFLIWVTILRTHIDRRRSI